MDSYEEVVKKRKGSYAEDLKYYKNALLGLLLLATITTVLQLLNVDGGRRRDSCVHFASGTSPLPIYFYLNGTTTNNDYKFVETRNCQREPSSTTRCTSPNSIKMFLTACHVLVAAVMFLFAKASGVSTDSKMTSPRIRIFTFLIVICGVVLITFFILELFHLLNIYPFSEQHPIINIIESGFDYSTNGVFTPTPQIPLGLTSIVILYAGVFCGTLLFGWVIRYEAWATLESLERFRAMMEGKELTTVIDVNEELSREKPDYE